MASAGRKPPRGGQDSHLLEEEDNPLDHFHPLLLQAEERAWRADEDLGLAEGRIVVKATPLQELLHRLGVGWEVVVRPREL